MFQIDHLDGSSLNVKSGTGEILTHKTMKQIPRKGMPFFDDAMEYGNLYVQFDIEYPQRSEIRNVELLKNVNFE